MQKDYFLYSAQSYTGVKFNVEKAKSLIERIDNEMAQIKSEVDPLLPPRPLKTSEEAFYRIPAKPFKKSGDLSSTMEKWLEKHSAKLFDGYIYAYDLKVKMEAGKVLPVKLPMEIEDNIELKQYFLDSGWKPHDDFGISNVGLTISQYEMIKGSILRPHQRFRMQVSYALIC